MNATTKISVGALSALILGVGAASAGSAPARGFEMAGPPAIELAFVENVAGHAQYRVGDLAWEPVRSGDLIPVGAVVRTGVRSSVHASLPDGTLVEVGSIARCELTADAAHRAGIRSTLAIDNADLESRLSRITPRRFDVVTPQPTLAVSPLRVDDSVGGERGRDDRFSLPLSARPR